MACPPLPPRLRLGPFELTEVRHRDRLGFVYVTRDGHRLREYAPPEAVRQGVRVLAPQDNDFVERGRRLGMEVLSRPEGLFWACEDPPGEPLEGWSDDLIAELADRLKSWHDLGLGHGALEMRCLRMCDGRLTVLDPLGDPTGDLKFLRSLAKNARGCLAWAVGAPTVGEFKACLKNQPQAVASVLPCCPRPEEREHRAWVRSLTFVGCQLFSGGEDWMLVGPQEEQDLGSWVCGLAALDGAPVALTQDGRVLHRGAVLWKGAVALAVSEKGELAVGLRTGTIRGTRYFGAHPPSMQALAFSPGGQLLAVAGGTTMSVWGEGDRRLEELETGVVRSLAFLPDSRLVTGGPELVLWDLYAGTSVSIPCSARCVAADPRGLGFASVGVDKAIRWWPLASLEPDVLGGHTGEVSALAFSPDGRWLASAGQDQVVRVWEVPE